MLPQGACNPSDDLLLLGNLQLDAHPLTGFMQLLTSSEMLTCSVPL